MLTYETLKKIMNEEKASAKLSALPPSFFAEAMEYLEAKSRLRESKEDQWEIVSARRMLEDLMDTRDRKILTAALYYPKTGSEPENMAEQEKSFFHLVVKNLEALQEERKKLLESREKMSIVALLTDIPRFVGIDMRNYGPFKQGDMATMPEDNAKVLVQKKAAKAIEVE